MRISTSTLFSEGVASMNQLQTSLARTQAQISTGRRILNPADDPAAAARATELNQADAANTQFAANRTAATNTLSLSESILGSVTSLLQDAQALTVQAGNATLNASDLRSIAGDLSGRLQELIGLANSTDGTGNFLFSGAQGRVQPFVETAAGVSYQGDDVQRLIQAPPRARSPAPIRVRTSSCASRTATARFKRRRIPPTRAAASSARGACWMPRNMPPTSTR